LGRPADTSHTGSLAGGAGAPDRDEESLGRHEDAAAVGRCAGHGGREVAVELLDEDAPVSGEAGDREGAVVVDLPGIGRHERRGAEGEAPLVGVCDVAPEAIAPAALVRKGAVRIPGDEVAWGDVRDGLV